jgi:hypothetical protein
MIAPIREPLFEPGTVTATPAALKAIVESGEEPREFLDRHIQGDWGSVFEEEGRRNDEALTTGARIVSEFRTGNGIKIWIVTAAADPT